jgi:hypothetical protein
MANERAPRLTGTIDSDYAWLKSHVPSRDVLETRSELVTKVRTRLVNLIERGQLPYTLGVFGGWGSGKTTFLAMLACELETIPQCRVVYFNSWKFAGFMEIVPALIYRILQYGSPVPEDQRGEAMRRVLLALGKKYSDSVGEWAADKVGINPVELFKDLYDLPQAAAQSGERTRAEVVKAYYTQVDRAQDELRRALGTVTPGTQPSNTVVALIDELDRCDPDEAFNVIKQMRVLFGMRDLPIAFVVCANPEPIGLSIKHRYGLESDSGDYEARRILEKFVDSYEDLSSAESLGGLVKTMWGRKPVPWIVAIDRDNVTPLFDIDTVGHATAFDAISTAVPLFRNIRVLAGC